MLLAAIKKRRFILAPIIFLSILSTVHLFYERDFFHVDTSAIAEENMPAALHLQKCITKTIESSGKLTPLKVGLQELVASLYQTGFVSKSEEDKNVRPYFVSLQGVFEQNLAFEMHRGKVKRVVGIIHTPTPAT